MDEDLLNTAIHNSKEHELVVDCSCRGWNSQTCKILYGTDSETSVASLANVGVTAHCRRWESLVLDFGSHALVQDYLSLPLPSLRRLSISRGWDGGVYNENHDHLIFGGENPRLVELSLDCYRLPWDRLVLDNLRSIHIGEGQHVGKVITADGILQLLSRTPLLESLSYSDCWEPSELVIEPLKVPVKIRKMQLTYATTSLAQGLCRSVIPHPLGVEGIHINIMHQSEDGHLTFFHHVGRILDLISPPCNAFYLHFTTYPDVEVYSLTLDLPPVHIELREALRAPGAVQALNTIFEVCVTDIGWTQRLAVKTVRLRLSYISESLALNILQQAHNAFPEITSLDLSGMSMGILPRLLQGLGASAGPLMPSLTELHIDAVIWEEVDDEVSEALEGFFRSRPLIEKWSFGGATCNNIDIYNCLQEITPLGTLKLSRDEMQDDRPLC